MKNVSLFTIALITTMSLCSYMAGAQGMAVNTTGAAANSSAILDVQSTTQGVLVPKMTTTQRNAISSPATGLLVWDNTIGGFYFYSGSAWVSLSSPTGTASGDLTGSYPGPSIASGAVTGAKIAASTITSTNIASGTITGSNIASGTITGTNVAASTITSTNIASGTIIGSNIANSTITGGKIAANTITTVNLPSGATSSTFLRGDNTWVAPSSSSASDVSVINVTSSSTINTAISDANLRYLIYYWPGGGAYSPNINVTLPSPSSWTVGVPIRIINVNTGFSSAANMTFITPSGTVSGLNPSGYQAPAASYNYGVYQGATLITDGTNWYMVNM